VYGMNFKHNFPELESEYGYPIVMGVMLAIIFGLLIMFRRKRWI